MSDVPYDELDEGVREVVRWLVSLGFHPTDSGDGRRAGAKADMDEALDVPHVFMVCPSADMVAEAHRLWDALVDRLAPEAMDAVHLQATYGPADGIAVLELVGLDDRLLALT